LLTERLQSQNLWLSHHTWCCVVYPSIGGHELHVKWSWEVHNVMWWMEGTDGIVMGCMWSVAVTSVCGTWDDNRVPNPTLSHFIPPWLHTVPHYIFLPYLNPTLVLCLPNPNPTLILISNNRYKSWKISNLYWTTDVREILILNVQYKK
jgi:hypothetical protein